jgi:NTE family protein
VDDGFSHRGTTLRTELKPPAFRSDAFALALSGGGFRATLFQLGAVEYLLEVGVLERVTYLSTVSGGSILGAKIALHWEEIFGAPVEERPRVFQALVAEPIKRVAAVDVRNRALRRGLRPRGWGRSRSENLASVLDEFLYNGARLRELPEVERLRIAINATNLRSGKRFRFSQDSMGEYQLGYGEPGSTSVAFAVAASAAFPLIFPPLTVHLQNPLVRWSFDNPPKEERRSLPETEMRVDLVDGGLYDNLGLQAASGRCGHIIAIDASLPLDVEQRNHRTVDGALRSVDVMMSQIVSHSVRRFVEELLRGTRKGVLIRATQAVKHIAAVSAPGVQTLDPESVAGVDPIDVSMLCRIRTDLDSFTQFEADLLRHHGRSLTHAALRRFQRSWIARESTATGLAAKLSSKERAKLKAGAVRRWSPLFAFWNGS